MARKLLHFIRTAEGLKDHMHFSINYAKKMGLDIQLIMILEQRNEYFYPMTSPIRADITTFEFERIREERIKKETARLKEFVDIQKNVPGKPKMSYVIESGATDIALVDYSKEPETELIVITESQEPENGFIINTYLHIVEHAECPVTKVPQKYNKALPMKKILYATDYKEEDIPTLNKIARMAEVFGSEITALHITDSIDLEEKMLSHGFESTVKDKIDYEKLRMKIYKSKDVVKGVLAFSEDMNFDLIAVLKENRNFIQRIFTRSDSNRILSKSTIPVMVLHEH